MGNFQDWQHSYRYCFYSFVCQSFVCQLSSPEEPNMCAKPSTQQLSSDVHMVAIIYSRVSTKGQQKGAGLETQVERARRYCAEQGYCVYAVEQDIHSGASLDRPGLQTALEAIRLHQVGILVADTLDRLSRNQTHQAVIRHQVEEQSGGRIEFITERLDDTPRSRFLRSTLGFVAEVEREMIMERTVRGKRRRAENGALLPGAVALYGYQWGPERNHEGRLAKVRLIPDPETAPIVQRIFREYVEGKSVRAIVRDLAADGIPTPSQYHALRGENGARMIAPVWNRESIRRILDNTFYKGEPEAYRHYDFKEQHVDAETGMPRIVKRKMTRAKLTRIAGMEEVAEMAGRAIPLTSDACPPLVDQATWQAVQGQIAHNTRVAIRNDKYAKDQLLRAGFARCAYCGRTMLARRNGKTMRYVCSSRYGSFGSAERYCPGRAPTVSVHILDADIWSKVLVMIHTNALLAKFKHIACQGATDAAYVALHARLEGFDATLAALVRRRQNLLCMQANAPDNETFEELDGQVKACTEQLSKATVEREELAIRIEQLVTASATQRFLPGLLDTSDRSNPAGGKPIGPSHRVQLTPTDQAKQDAAMRAYELWAAPLRAKGQDFNYEEKRGLLRYFGVRVDVYRKNDKRLDGTHWELHTSLEDIDDFH
ncbi:MAG TPA: recombinase family protein [Ktedonobacterales bacterium]|nr:recombinase family protein [Ktedonobacterales bacterium]